MTPAAADTPSFWQRLHRWWTVADVAADRADGWLPRASTLTVAAPAGTTNVGVELWVPRSWRAPRAAVRLAARDALVGHHPDFGPYFDICCTVTPGRWQTVEWMLPVPTGADSTMIIDLELARPSPRWPHLPLPRWAQRRARLRRAWARGPRLRAAEVVIVVLNWRQPAATIECLDSLAAADLDGARVLVVDNGSNDGSVDAIRAHRPDQWIVALDENQGYAGGNNAGIRAALEAGAQGVVLLNNDARVAPDCLVYLLRAFNSDRGIAGVSSAILRADHPEILDIAWLDLYWGHGIVRRRGVNALPGDGYDVRREVDAAVGCCLLLGREALDAIGPLDEAYFAYHEEVDWCLRAQRAGFRLCYEPYARVWHGGSKSTERFDQPLRTPRRQRAQLAMPMPLSWNPVRTYLGARNTVRFVRNNGDWGERLYFAASSAYNVPLEFLAMLMREEEALKIGAFGFRRALALHCLDERAGGAAGWLRAGARLLGFPAWLLRETRAAHAEGRDAQVLELLRGLWDGLLDRELPLKRLGLR